MAYHIISELTDDFYCEQPPEPHAWGRSLRAHIDYPDTTPEISAACPSCLEAIPELHWLAASDLGDSPNHVGWQDYGLLGGTMSIDGDKVE